METFSVETTNASACLQLQQLLNTQSTNDNEIIQESSQKSLKDISILTWDETNCSQLLNELTNSELNGQALEFPYYIRSTATIVCTIVLILGTTGNLLVPIVVIKTKELRNSTNLFLINLSIADLLVLIVCMPTVLIELHTKPEIWHLGKWMCKAVPFVEMVVAHSSILTISAISFERYYAICKPLKAGYKCTKVRALIIIAIVWIIAILSTAPMLYITELSYAEYVDGSIVPVCLSRVQGLWNTLYFFLILATFFALPFLILIVLYGLIAKNLVIDSRMISSNSEKYQMRLRKQVVFMLAAVMINFFICLLPFRIFSLWIIIVPQEKLNELGMEGYYNLLYFCRILLYINSATNPILYNICSSNFRRGFCQTLGIRKIRKRLLRRNGTSVHTSVTLGNSSIKSRSTHSSAGNNININNNNNNNNNNDNNCGTSNGQTSDNYKSKNIGIHIQKMVNTLITVQKNGHRV